MSYYHVCPNCGSHLDPGERCDCKLPRSQAIIGRLTIGQGTPPCPRLLHHDRKAAEYAGKTQSQSIEKQNKNQRRQHHEHY